MSGGNADGHELWELARTALGAANRIRIEAVQPFLAETGLDGSTFVLLMLLFAMDPDAAPITDLRKVSFYTSSNRFRTLLGGAVAAGLADEPEPGVYRLTQSGRSHIAAVSERTEDLLVQRRALEPADGRRMFELLTRVVDAAVSASTPREPWFTLQSRALVDARPGADEVAAVVGCLACLDAFRGDAHAASWAATELGPVEAEMMTLLWRDSSFSFVQLMERLEGIGHRRGHSPLEYQAALGQIRLANFVIGPDERLALSQEGLGLREAVEADTDRRFYAAWRCLDEVERLELRSLSIQLADRLAAP